MAYFRCHNCWAPLEYSNGEDYVSCPDCDADLYMGNLTEGFSKTAKENPE